MLSLKNQWKCLKFNDIYYRNTVPQKKLKNAGFKQGYSGRDKEL